MWLGRKKNAQEPPITPLLHLVLEGDREYILFNEHLLLVLWTDKTGLNADLVDPGGIPGMLTALARLLGAKATVKHGPVDLSVLGEGEIQRETREYIDRHATSTPDAEPASGKLI